MNERPTRTGRDSTWYLNDTQGFTWLPYCSADYTPSSRLYDTCLRDPEGPICRRHRTFFRTRKATA